MSKPAPTPTFLSLLLASILLAACGAAAPVAKPSPSAVATVATISEDPNLNCRLPVAGFIPAGTKQQQESNPPPEGQSGQKGVGGFVDLPSGKYTPVAGSDSSYLAGSNAWLPVSPQAIAPDQRSYVLTKTPRSSIDPPTTTLYKVDVATRAERLLFTPPAGHGAYVLAFTTDGVYVETAPSQPSQGLTVDLILIDPSTGAHHQVARPAAQPNTQLAFAAVAGGAAWGTSYAISQDPSQQTAPISTLVRLGLHDGSLTEWYHSSGLLYLAGFDNAGHPIVFSMSQELSGGQMVLASAPNQIVPLPTQGASFIPTHQDGFVTDRHGTWVGSSDGSIWLYTSAKGFVKVASIPPLPGGSGSPYDDHGGRTIAGPCV